MKVCFQLRMPNVGSWNGRWTGQSDKYYLLRTVRGGTLENSVVRKLVEEKKTSFYYDFEDGWGASISMEVVGAVEARKRQRVSVGFSTYEWMVDEILQYGRILKRDERKELQKATS